MLSKLIIGKLQTMSNWRYWPELAFNNSTKPDVEILINDNLNLQYIFVRERLKSSLEYN